MNPVSRGGGWSVKLSWLMRDVLVVHVMDARAVKEQVEQLEREIALLTQRAGDLYQRRDALAMMIRGGAAEAKLLGATKEELAQVVGEQVAESTFQVVEF